MNTEVLIHGEGSVKDAERGGAQTIPVSARREFDRICDDFELAWRGGGAPRLEAYLPELPEPDLSELTRQLLEVEIEQRTSRGEIPPLPAYGKRFPALAKWLRKLMADGSAQATEDAPGIAGAQTPVADSLVGRTFGQYAVVDRLGEGGMGAVFRVRHTMIDCERALKVLKAGLATDERAIKRFLTEAQACIGLSHPNVVSTYDVAQNGDGAVYLVMELLEGRNLDELVKAEGPLDFSLAAEIIRQAAAGLDYAHRQGAIHRDVKPHNIMWTSAGTAKILDLGLARLMDAPGDIAHVAAGAGERPFDAFLSRLETRLTDGKTLLGTLAYISPEQAADARQADAQSDIYSLGCTFYYLLTGRHAFTGRTPQEVLERHLVGAFQPIAGPRPDIPPALEAIAARMMESDRALRYSSGSDVQKALFDWLTPARPVKRRPATIFNIDDPQSMREALTSRQLVSEADWHEAQSEAEGGGVAPVNAHSPPTPELFVRQGKLSPGMAILLQLWRRHGESGAASRGLSEFQIVHLLNGHIDLLRLPEHVLLEQIGAGWKGDVFKARHLQTGRIEALRTLAPQKLDGLPGEGVERIPAFRAAVEDLQELSHPSLAKVHFSGDHENRVHGEFAYLSTEFIEGETLADRIANLRASKTSDSNAGWPANVVRGVSRLLGKHRDAADALWGARIVRDICRGLEHAHENGVLHLDIHAGAILIDDAERPRLVDLGVARLMTPRAIPLEAAESREMMTLSSERPKRAMRKSASRADRWRGQATFMPPPPIGTPVVMPPEQWRDREDVSAATDIYNLGCTLFFAVAGEYCFASESAMEAMQKHLHAKPLETPAAKNVPRPLRPLLGKCLAKAPHERFASVADLRAALDSVLES